MRIPSVMPVPYFATIKGSQQNQSEANISPNPAENNRFTQLTLIFRPFTIYILCENQFIGNFDPSYI